MLSRLKGKLRVPNSLLWQVGMWISLFACVSFFTLFWLRGFTDTKDATDTGRRLLIALENGAITGKINTTQPVKVAEEEKPQEKKTEDVLTAEEKPQEKKTEDVLTAEETPKEVILEKDPASSEPLKKPDAETPAAAAPDEPKVEAPPQEAKPVEDTKIIPGEELPVDQQPEYLEDKQETVTIVPSNNPLPDVNSKLIEKSEIGELPVIGGDGTKAWQYYAKPFERKGKKPMIAIIITGLGHSKYVTEKSLALSGNFTLSFSPYARGVQSWANTARLTAHEKLVDLPMEASNYPATDPGSYGLILNKGLQENENRLKWLMSRFPGHIGFITPYNEVYSHNEEALKVLLQSLSNRGLVFVMGHEPAKTETKEILDTTSTPSLISDMLVDEELTDNAIDTRLSALEQLAIKRGYAVGMVSPTPLALERLKAWSETLEGRDIQLVPISAVIKLRFS